MLKKGTYTDCEIKKVECLEGLESDGATLVSVRMHLVTTLTSGDEETTRRLLRQLREVRKAVAELRKIGNEADIADGPNTFKLKVKRPFAKQQYRLSIPGCAPVSCLVEVGGDPEVHVVEGDVAVRWKALTTVRASDLAVLGPMVKRDDIEVTIRPEQQELAIVATG